MNKDEANKNFDCVKFMREARDRISAEIADMSSGEVVNWFNSRQYAYPWSTETGERVRKSIGNPPEDDGRS